MTEKRYWEEPTPYLDQPVDVSLVDSLDAGTIFTDGWRRFASNNPTCTDGMGTTTARLLGRRLLLRLSPPLLGIRQWRI